MTTVVITIIVIFISSAPVINSLTCLTCQTVSNSVVLVTLTDMMFNRSSLPTTTDCAHNVGTTSSVSCPEKCITVIVQSADDMYAIRGCASVLFKAAQLAALQVSAANIVSLNNTCYTSQPDSITGIAPALASVCFCDTDSCNAASWDAIMPTVAAQSGTSALTTISLSSSSVVMRIVIVIACFIASGN